MADLKALARQLGFGNQQGLGLTPSPERSQLIQLLQQQAAQGGQSKSPIESLNIASKPILAALLAKQQGAGRENVDSRAGALAQALSRAGGGDQQSMQDAMTIAGDPALGGHPLSNAVQGLTAQRAFAVPEPPKIEDSSDLRTIRDEGIRTKLGIGPEDDVEVIEQKRDGKIVARFVNGPNGRISLTGNQVGGTTQRTRAGTLPGGEQERLRDAQVATQNFVDTTRDALNLINETPDLNTLTARAASITNDIQQEAIALARQFGIEFSPVSLDANTHAGTFDQLGIKNAQLRGLITALAFQAAASSGQENRAVSNVDIERFIKEIGATSSDPRAFAQTLLDVTNRTVRNFKNNYSIRMEAPFEGDFGASNLGDIFKDSEPVNNQPPDLSQMTDQQLEALIRGN